MCRSYQMTGLKNGSWPLCSSPLFLLKTLDDGNAGAQVTTLSQRDPIDYPDRCAVNYLDYAHDLARSRYSLELKDRALPWRFTWRASLIRSRCGPLALGWQLVWLMPLLWLWTGRSGWSGSIEWGRFVRSPRLRRVGRWKSRWRSWGCSTWFARCATTSLVFPPSKIPAPMPAYRGLRRFARVWSVSVRPNWQGSVARSLGAGRWWCQAWHRPRWGCVVKGEKGFAGLFSGCQWQGVNHAARTPFFPAEPTAKGGNRRHPASLTHPGYSR